MRQWEHARLSKVFIRRCPEIYQEIMSASTPELRDTRLIELLYAYYLQKFPTPLDREEAFLHKLVFISSILRLFCPSALFFNLRVTGKIVTILTKTMGYNHKQSLSYFVTQSRVYIKNKSFIERVETLSEELKVESKRLMQTSEIILAPVTAQYSFGF